MTKSFIFYFLIINFFITNFSFSQTNFFSRSKPVVDLGLPGQWDDYEVSHHEVIFDGKEYKMWYTGQTLIPERTIRIGYATSSDGISWTKYLNNPVLEGSENWESTATGTPVILYHDSVYKMWYSGGIGNNQVGYATSFDGINWDKHTENPVLTVDVGWENTFVVPCEVIFQDSIYRMWYAGSDENFKIQIGYATSFDGISWKKHQANPVFKTGVNGSWDDGMVYTPDIMHNGIEYQMWYMGFNGNVFQIGFAFSEDGKNWTKYEENPIFKPPLGNNSDVTSIGHPRVIFDGKNYKMWHFINNGNNVRIGYAEDFEDSIVYPDTFTVTRTAKSLSDNTFEITSDINNPNRNEISVYMALENINGNYTDQLLLADNGLNGDKSAGDGIYASRWIANDIEDILRVGIRTEDRETDFTFNGLRWNGFWVYINTKGPVIINSSKIVSNDTIANPNDLIAIDISLKNMGNDAAIRNIETLVFQIDSCLIPVTKSRKIDSLQAGENKFHQAPFSIKLDPSCSDTTHAMGINVFENNEHFWTDTFYIDVSVVGIAENSFFPDKYELLQNYPNPFNPTTTIEYSLPKTTKVKLTVFDIAGREVKNLIDKKQPAGKHGVTFDASLLPSGVYFYRLSTSEGFSQSKKMILLK